MKQKNTGENSQNINHLEAPERDSERLRRKIAALESEKHLTGSQKNTAESQSEQTASTEETEIKILVGKAKDYVAGRPHPQKVNDAIKEAENQCKSWRTSF